MKSASHTKTAKELVCKVGNKGVRYDKAGNGSEVIGNLRGNARLQAANEHSHVPMGLMRYMKGKERLAKHTAPHVWAMGTGSLPPSCWQRECEQRALRIVGQLHSESDPEDPSAVSLSGQGICWKPRFGHSQ